VHGLSFKKDDVIIWALLLLLANILYTIAPAYGLVFLGAGFIFWGPFIVMERFAYPYLRTHPRASIIAGWCSVALGGYFWYLAFH